jgi:hypothetical protein
MIPSPDWRDVFCGRDVELKQLISAYDAVADGSGPRLAVVTAERGMGKTRLVQELYRILSTERDPADYWPDASLFKGNNLLVAPDFNEALTKAHFASFKTSERPMPFLWWGFRLNDLLGRNAWGSDMAGHRRTLDPHLARALFARMDAASREKLRGSAFNTITGAALAIAEALLDGVPGVGPFKSFVEFARGIRKAKKERDKLHDQACTFAQADITALEAKRTQEIYERTLEELALVLEPTAPLEKLPTVVFCDDAQFARDGGDEGALRFLDKLWQRAEKGKWPLLLVATHWESNWGLDRLGENASFAKTFGSVADDANKSTIIRLSQQSDLGVLIDRGLPGLPAKDVAYLLHQSDGNPQMLIELVGLINTRETYRAHGALTPHAYGNIEKLSENLTTMITDRLNSDATPDDVKVAIALSSLQGMQFLSSLTDETAEVLQGVEFCSSLTETAAKALKLGAASSGLNKAADPLRLIVGLEAGIASFVQRAYREAAESLVGGRLSTKPEVIKAAVLRAAITIIDAPDRWALLDAEKRRAMLGVMASLAEDSPDDTMRVRAGNALAELVKLATENAQRAAYAKQFSAGLNSGKWPIDAFTFSLLDRVRCALGEWYGDGDTVELCERIIEVTRARQAAEPHPIGHAETDLEADSWQHRRLWKAETHTMRHFP